MQNMTLKYINKNLLKKISSHARNVEHNFVLNGDLGTICKYIFENKYLHARIVVNDFQ